MPPAARIRHFARAHLRSARGAGKLNDSTTFTGFAPIADVICKCAPVSLQIPLSEAFVYAAPGRREHAELVVTGR